METAYIILIETDGGLEVKGYSSFSRLCSENGIKKKAIDKKDLPVKVGNKTIVDVKIDNRI